MITVTVALAGPMTGLLDQSTVAVALTEQAHAGVLAVPVTALHALPGARYEVVVVEGTTKRPVPVQTGLFDEATGLAEVSGPGLAEGQHVEVPGGGA